jgi:hypothetical protein
VGGEHSAQWGTSGRALDSCTVGAISTRCSGNTFTLKPGAGRSPIAAIFQDSSSLTPDSQLVHRVRRLPTNHVSPAMHLSQSRRSRNELPDTAPCTLHLHHRTPATVTDRSRGTVDYSDHVVEIVMQTRKSDRGCFAGSRHFRGTGSRRTGHLAHSDTANEVAPSSSAVSPCS